MSGNLVLVNMGKGIVRNALYNEVYPTPIEQNEYDGIRPEFSEIESPVKRCGACVYTPYGASGESEYCSLTGNMVSAWNPACSLFSPGQTSVVGNPYEGPEGDIHV